MACAITLERILALRLVWVRGRPGVPEYLVADVRRAVLGDRDHTTIMHGCERVTRQLDSDPELRQQVAVSDRANAAAV